LIWGGRRLGTVFHKPIGEHTDYAESWEISDYRDSVSVIENGPLAGQTIRDLLEARGFELLGSAVGALEQFPLLVKFIDAQQVLSVQVHPDDATGKRLVNDNGKTETWVILDAAPASAIYAGLNRDVDQERFTAAIHSGSVEPLLHRFEPKAGDAILIEAGTVHAIGAGVLLVEIQQMSDATFRVDDWGRVGPDGKPRELHLAHALESIDFDRGPVDPLPTEPLTIPGGVLERLARSAYFTVDRLTLTGKSDVGAADRFTILIGLDGRLDVIHNGQSFPLGFGETMLLPASIGRCQISPHGQATILTCQAP
jgi:mannose-6-phosphate isomerase